MAGGEGAADDEMVGWHHQLDGHEFEQLQDMWGTEEPGVLQCMSCKESDMT